MVKAHALATNLPALQIVVPLLAAPVCVLLRRPLLVRIWSGLAALACFAVSTALLITVIEHGPISYAMGGWAPPWGIEYRVDLLSGFVLVVISALAAVVVPLGPGANSHSIPQNKAPLFYAPFLLCVAGLLGMTITGDAFNVFVFLEISSLSTYILVGLGRSRAALKAAFSYLIMGTVGGTFILIGIGLLYQMTGSLNMADLARLLGSLHGSRTVVVAFAFFTVGIAIKLAVFPLHQWLPNAYSRAPATVSAFIAGTATKVIYYLWIRFIFCVFGAAFVFDVLDLDLLLLPVSLVAMFAGATAAIYQTDFRRLLAYSSISQIGYLTLALSFGTQAGVAAGLTHLFNHALMKSGLFLVAACWIAKVGSARLADLQGLGRKMPLTAGAFAVGGLGLIGVPGTVGFISKWYLVSAAFQSGQIWVAAAILLSSLLAVAYVWRVVEVLFFRRPLASVGSGEAPVSLLGPAWLVAIASIVFGLYTDMPVSVAQRAAERLTAATPLAAEADPAALDADPHPARAVGTDDGDAALPQAFAGGAR